MRILEKFLLIYLYGAINVILVLGLVYAVQFDIHGLIREQYSKLLLIMFIVGFINYKIADM